MSPSPQLPSSRPSGAAPAHSEEWDERLQDWLDGELNDAHRAVFEAHLASCSQCQQTQAAFERLDSALVTATPPIELGADFDRQLFARIDAIDETQRLAAKRRLEQEWQQQMQALSRNWKRTLAFMIPGVVAGIALAMTLTYWLDSSGLTGSLVAQGTAELGSASGSWLRVAIPSLVGATLGLLVAPWLARLSE